MAKILSTTNGPLGVALDVWQDRAKFETQSIQALSGSGNDSYLITSTEHQQQVIRLNGDTTHLGVNRQRESEVLQAIKTLSIAAPCLFASENFSVFEYIHTQGEASIRSIAESLSRLHQHTNSWSDTQPRWTPNDTIENYLQLAPGVAPYFIETVRHLKQIDWQNCHFGICHIDLNPQNILPTATGVKLIDWEYSRVGPTIYDIAVFMQTHGDINLTEFLKHYELQVPKQTLELARLAYDVIEVLWFSIAQPEEWPEERTKQKATELQTQLSGFI